MTYLAYLITALAVAITGCSQAPAPTRHPDAAGGGEADVSPPGPEDGDASTDPAGDAGFGPDSGTTPDSDTDIGANDDAARPPSDGIEIAATTATLANTFTANVTGATAGRIGAVAITDNVGTIEIDGKAWPAFGNERQEWPDFELTLVQTLVVTDEAIYPMWLYCTGSTFDGVYYEGTDGTAMTWEPATSGSCAVSQTANTRSVTVPAVTMDFPVPDHSFTVTDGPLAVQPGSAGTLATGGVTWQVYPFEVVDCTLDCGTPGWWELHAMLWNGADACFSIFYFFEDRMPQISYSICLPTLTDLIGEQTFNGSWSN